MMMKYDEGKLRYDLITPEFLEGLAKVMTFGAEKYEPNSWQNVEDGYNRYYSALMRHLEAIRMGEVVDADSGLPHIYHVGCNAMFLNYFINNREEIKQCYGTYTSTTCCGKL
jgi:hypothetical protein